MIDLKNIKNLISQWKLNTPTARAVSLYFVFVLISFIFWAFLSLNNNLQFDMVLPVKISSVPDSTTIISNVPDHISVNVKDRGMSLLKFIIGDRPTLNIKFKDYAQADGRFYVSNSELRRRVRALFENSTTVQGLSLEEINLKYTNLPAKKVPIMLDLDIRPNIQYVIYGSVDMDADSVLVYSDRNTLAKVEEVYTYRVEERELTDTLLRVVSLSPIQGAKLVPDKVTLTIPVEPLITKKIDIPINVKNMPGNVNVITFPSKVGVSFLVPFSMYRTNYPFNAVVDYRDIINTKGNKVGISIDESPALYDNISLLQDSVEFIIEKH